MDYNTIPTDDVINTTVKALTAHGITVETVGSGKEALSRLQELIPTGAAVMNGSSTTLNQIGYTNLLKSGETGWRNLHKEILEEKDKGRQADLRRKSLAEADYFLASPNAITEDGLLVAVDATGSRTGAFPFAAKKLLLVAGVQKIVPNLHDAFDRIREYVFPLENERAKKAYGAGSTLGKWVIIEKEVIPQRIHLILIKEKLGF